MSQPEVRDPYEDGLRDGENAFKGQGIYNTFRNEQIKKFGASNCRIRYNKGYWKAWDALDKESKIPKKEAQN